MANGDVPPSRLLASLGGRHLASWPEQRLRVLALYCLGYEEIEIARLIGLSQSTVRYHVREARAGVFDYLEISANQRSLTAWFWLHATCCTAGILTTIQTDSGN